MEMTEIPRLIVMYDDKNRIIVLTHHILDNFLHFLMHIFIPFKNVISRTFHSGKIEMIYILLPLLIEILFY